MRAAKSSSPKTSELQRHFQHYFELLLGNERAALQQAIAIGCDTPSEKLSAEVEQRIAYLRGAVRIGSLLCLIDAEEAKLKHDLLAYERDTLLAHCFDRRTAASND